MLSFALPDGLDAEALATALGRPVRPGPAATGDRRYYDTFDGRLHRAGLALAHERRRLLVLGAAGEERAAADLAAAPRQLFAADLPQGAVRELVAPLIEMRVLTPVARVTLRRQALAVLDDEEKTVVRLALEAPAGLDARLHVAGVRGYDKELERVWRALTGLGLEEAGGPVATPAGVSSKVGVKLKPGSTGAVAASRLCLRLVEVIRDNLPGTLADTDSEFLHDLRVAVRRTRSLQRELRDVFEPGALQRARDDFRWLQQVTGPVRDLDVYLLDFDDFRAALPPAREDDLEPLRDLLIRRRRAERRALVRALRSERTERLLADWTALLAGLPQGAGTGPAGEAPVAEIAGARIRKVYARMVRDGSAIDDDTPAEALHDLRKKGKELRYLLEFFGGLYPAEVAKPMVASLKALQDTLGRFQDREVQAELIASLGPDIADPRALMAMGQLVDRLERQQAAARDEFAERFAAFAAKDQRRLVKEAFA